MMKKVVILTVNYLAVSLNGTYLSNRDFVYPLIV